MTTLADPFLLAVPSNGEAKKKPDTDDRKSLVQMRAGVTFAGGEYPAPPAGDFATYRRMIAHPTIALARAVVHGPIVTGSWTFEAGEDAKDEWVSFIQKLYEGLRPFLVPQMLRCLDYGFQPFERVWAQKPVKVGKASRLMTTVAEYVPLLPDITTILVTAKGEFAGLKQKKVELDPLYSFCVSWDVEAGNYYGRARNENVREAWWKWVQTDERSGALTTKVSNIIPMMHYPLGSSRDASGREVTNFEVAMTVLQTVASGRGIAFPNMYANSNDSRVDAELAGKSAWVIDFLEAAGAAQALDGVTGRQKYYDTLMMRGWLVPERAATEGQFGTKAEAESHADLAILACTQVDEDLARQVNRQIDDVLELNFGAEARGQVFIKPAPLADEKLGIFREIFKALLGNPGTLEELVTQIDIDAVCDALKIPKPDGAVIDFGDAVVNPTVGRVPPIEDEDYVPPGDDKRLSMFDDGSVVWRMIRGRRVPIRQHFAKEADGSGAGGKHFASKSSGRSDDQIKKDLTSLHDYAIREPHGLKEAVGYREVSGAEIERLKRDTGLDLAGYEHEVDSEHLRKIDRDHGPVRIDHKGRGIGETDQSQEPIGSEDVRRLPEIISTPDVVRRSTVDGKSGEPRIEYEKRDNGIIYVVEEVRTGRKTLTLKTMYKKKA